MRQQFHNALKWSEQNRTGNAQWGYCNTTWIFWTYLSISVLSRQFSQSKSVPRNDCIEMVGFPWQLMHPLQLGKHSYLKQFTQNNNEAILLQIYHQKLLKILKNQQQKRNMTKNVSASNGNKIECTLLFFRIFSYLSFVASRWMPLRWMRKVLFVKMSMDKLFLTINWFLHPVSSPQPKALKSKMNNANFDIPQNSLQFRYKSYLYWIQHFWMVLQKVKWEFTCGLSSGRPNRGLLGTYPISASTATASSPHEIYMAPPSWFSTESTNKLWSKTK